MRQTVRACLFALVLSLCVFVVARPAAADDDPNRALATFVLRTPDGAPVMGATCLMESGMWGVPADKVSATIATGETDSAGRVSFDVSVWPQAPYRVHFMASTHMQPQARIADLDHDAGSFTPILGGKRITYYLALDPSGSVYSDHSSGQGVPAYQTTPDADFGGNANPKPISTPMWSIIQTMSALRPTPEPPPSLTPGQLLQAINQPTAAATPSAPSSAPAQPQPAAQPTPAWVLILVIVAAACVLLFGRRWLYPALGITYVARPSRSARLVRAIIRPKQQRRAAAPVRIAEPTALADDEEEE